jgi:hypothetical protein
MLFSHFTLKLIIIKYYFINILTNISFDSEENSNIINSLIFYIYVLIL